MRTPENPTLYLQHLEQQGRAIDPQRIPLSALEDAMDHPRTLITGKTTLLPYLAYLWATALLDARTWTLLFPLYLSLPDVSPGESVPDHLARRSRHSGWGLSAAFFRRLLDTGAALVFLDNVDHSTASMVEAAASAWPRCRFVAAAHSTAPPTLAGFRRTPIATIDTYPCL